MKKKNVVVLGSTGSIGVNTLNVVRQHRDEFRVIGLAANRNIDLILRQIREFKPKYVALDHTPSADSLLNKIKSWKRRPTVLNHADGLERIAAAREADVVIFGMVGARGLLPLISAIKQGKTVGLANKEALVIAGDIIMNLAKRYGSTIVPVDSEHSAIFQCLRGHHESRISRIILTASGGPFYRREKNLRRVSVPEALAHPTWKMGAKITVDSATLMNKGLEAIEAHHLFGVPMEKISIVIHPQSIIHSLVEFEDGSNLAQLSHPDMRIPIQYALTYPSRRNTLVRRLNLEEVGKLDFFKPNFSKFPCLGLALRAGRAGGCAPAVLNAANEEAVKAFISGRIPFLGIAKVVATVLAKRPSSGVSNLKKILEMDAWARKEAQKVLNH